MVERLPDLVAFPHDAGQVVLLLLEHPLGIGLLDLEGADALIQGRDLGVFFADDLVLFAIPEEYGPVLGLVYAADRQEGQNPHHGHHGNHRKALHLVLLSWVNPSRRRRFARDSRGLARGAPPGDVF